MPETKQVKWAADFAAQLRDLPGDWDDRRGKEFDLLPSDDRARICRRRNDCLISVGSLLLWAILDHGWLSEIRFAPLRKHAETAREFERKRPYEIAALIFLESFTRWCADNTDRLPPEVPALRPLKCQNLNFFPENVVAKDFELLCNAIAVFIESTVEPQPEQEAQPGKQPPDFNWAKQSELVRAADKVLGEGTLNKGVLSRACTDRHIETNGEAGRAARVQVESFIRWVGRQHELDNEELAQIRNAVIGEIISRRS
ncbi:MAG: hypothetical protein J5J06_13785 [Phycisphaerae bacterium]|nr:hypothetical protein [Phycisphaerae bacterium]